MSCKPFKEILKVNATDRDMMLLPQVAPTIHKAFQVAMMPYRCNRSNLNRITYDDVVNLHNLIIDCSGVSEFIERM